MKYSTFLGSAVSVLLVFSAISHASAYIQQQNPKPAQQPSEAASERILPPEIEPADSPKPVTASKPVESSPSKSDSTSGTVLGNPAAIPPLRAAESYTATAYSLKGRTASGRPVGRGLIAADPRVLPLGTRVRVDAGAWSGEYVVADTGGLVKGRRIDIWTPTSREAMRFGRRAVKLTVVELGGKRAKKTTARSTLATTPTTSPASATTSKPAR